VNLVQALGEPIETAATLEAGDLRIRLDATARVRSIYDLGERHEYFTEGQPSPLLSVDLGSRVEALIYPLPGEW
jgi:hypothetical protein